MEHKEEEHHILGFNTHCMVWLALLVLTGLTVAVAGLDMGRLNVVVALLVAVVKTSLVIMFFMHLKYEDKSFALMLFMTLCIVGIIMALTFTDTVYRDTLIKEEVKTEVQHK